MYIALLTWLFVAPYAGFRLPGLPRLPSLTEVFPEIRNIWPRWTLKNTRRIPCKRDSDCPFPSTCCIHPIFPGNKQCCTGFGQRLPVKKYAFNYIQPSNPQLPGMV